MSRAALERDPAISGLRMDVVRHWVLISPDRLSRPSLAMRGGLLLELGQSCGAVTRDEYQEGSGLGDHCTDTAPRMTWYRQDDIGL
jgi:hypothetical protein